MLLLNFATVPTTVDVIMGRSPDLPELSLVTITLAGLTLYMTRAIALKDKLYMTSNGIALVLYVVLLVIVW